MYPPQGGITSLFMELLLSVISNLRSLGSGSAALDTAQPQSRVDLRSPRQQRYPSLGRLDCYLHTLPDAVEQRSWFVPDELDVVTIAIP